MTLNITGRCVKGNRKKTKFRDVSLSKSNLFGYCLYMNGELHSAEKDENIRYEMLVHPAMASNPKAKEVLILGDGTGASVRELLKLSLIHISEPTRPY